MQSRVIKTLLTTESIWSFGAGLFFPIFAIFSSEIGGDITDAGIAAAIFILVTALLEYPIGKLLDKYHEKYFIVADYLLEACVFIGYIFVENIWELFLLQVVLGFANAIGDPAWESLYGRSTPHKKSGSSWANSHFYIGIFNAVGIVIGSYLVALYGFQSVFALGAVFSGFAGVLALMYIKKE
jgi:DHA1 family quinolone resistance protein-like MFS transporter